MAPIAPPLHVRPALPSDEAGIRRLLTHTPRAPLQLWPWEEQLGQDCFLVALSGKRLMGTLMAWPDGGPVAWVRLAIVDNAIPVGVWLDHCLPPLLQSLRGAAVQTLAWMDAGRWAGRSLKVRGFRPLTRLVMMAKEMHTLPAAPANGTTLRAGQLSDLPAVVEVDHAAFPPAWWLSRETLQRLHEDSSCFLLAEQGGRCMGYVEARLLPPGAHIGRLAVSPAAQGQGVGSLLLSAALTRLWELGAQRVTLNTQEDNRSSLRLYNHFGFYPVGNRVTAWQREV